MAFEKGDLVRVKGQDAVFSYVRLIVDRHGGNIEVVQLDRQLSYEVLRAFRAGDVTPLCKRCVRRVSVRRRPARSCSLCQKLAA